MKCEDCLSLIEEHFDGDLDEKKSLAVSSHIAACRSCADEYDALCREQELYASYQRDIEITPALWKGIESRIKAAKPVRSSFADRIRAWMAVPGAPRLSLVATAALVLMAVSATVAVMSYLNSRNASVSSPVATGGPEISRGVEPGEKTAPESPAVPDKQPTPVSTGGSRSTARKANPTPEQLIREAEQKYIAAIAMLSKEVDRRRPEIDPTVMARFENALAAIDRTIEETKKAVRQGAHDPIIAQYMLAAYAKKVDVLREMAND
jgi:anti-sigma factor RsiW